jgi:hypothetical protein
VSTCSVRVMEELLRTLSRVLSTHIFPYAAAVAAPFLSWSSVLGLAALLLGYYGLRAAGGGAAGGAAAAVAGAAAGHRAGPAAHAAAGGHAPDDGVQAALFARAQVPAPPCGGQAGRGSVSVSYNAPACSYPCVSFPIPSSTNVTLRPCTDPHALPRPGHVPFGGSANTPSNRPLTLPANPDLADPSCTRQR